MQNEFIRSVKLDQRNGTQHFEKLRLTLSHKTIIQNKIISLVFNKCVLPL